MKSIKFPLDLSCEIISSNSRGPTKSAAVASSLPTKSRPTIPSATAPSLSSQQRQPENANPLRKADTTTTPNATSFLSFTQFATSAPIINQTTKPVQQPEAGEAIKVSELKFNIQTLTLELSSSYHIYIAQERCGHGGMRMCFRLGNKAPTKCSW